jgi:hypothetical protein
VTRSMPTPVIPLAPVPRRRRQAGAALALVAVTILLAVSGAAWWATRRQVDRALSALDEQALQEAERALSHTFDHQRRQALSEVKLLVDDSRIRGTVITPHFDETTVRDVLDDLQEASGATVLAVLDATGKVQAASGIDSLRNVDLGAATAVRVGMERPAASIWTFPDRVLVIAVAPIRAGKELVALLMLGFDLGQRALTALERTRGVAGALFVADRMVADGSTDGGQRRAFEEARAAPDRASLVVHGGRDFLARVKPLSDSATAARVVWLVERHHQAVLLGALPVAAAVPTVLICLGCLLTIAWMIFDRRKGGSR